MKVINFGGKERPVKYDINALAEFNEATGTDLEWIFRIATRPLKINLNQIRYLVYFGLKYGSEESGKMVDFTVKDVGLWLGSEMEKLGEFMNEFKNSMPLLEDSSKNLKSPKKSGI